MTDLLSRALGRPAAEPDTAAGAERRPPALAAALVGVAAPAAVLLVLWAVGLAGWFADDGGSHGDTRGVLRVAADAWLLGHGASLDLRGYVVSASPLGLTALCWVVTYRLARWAGRTSAVDDLRTAGHGSVVLAGLYAVTALTVAALASVKGAEPDLTAAFTGGLLIGATAGGAGLLRGAGLLGTLRRRVPVPVLSAGYTAVVTTGLLLAAGFLLVAVALAARFPGATRVTDALDLDLTGGVLSVLLLVGIAPNLALLAVSYLLGPGFSVGTDTVVSTSLVDLGPVPSVPVLAALPDQGWTPEWLVALHVLPPVVALAAAYVVGVRLVTRSYRDAAVRGLGGGTAAALLLTVLVARAGGGIGPGRMADLGAPSWSVLEIAFVSLAGGGLVGALAATWWARRRDLPVVEHPATIPAPPTTRPLVAKPRGGGEETTDAVHLPPVEGESLTPRTTRPGPRDPDAGPRPEDLSDEVTTAIPWQTPRSPQR